MKSSLPDFWSFNRIRDTSLIKTEDILWKGPFSWIGFEHVNKLGSTTNFVTDSSYQ